ncbi:MAG: FAD-dependent oxidoreductase [Phormidesmis sp.]
METLPPKAVIIGAGPAGLLLAHYLLARHYQVEIYERRADPRTVSPSQQRSFPISLQERGRQALRGIPQLEATIADHSVFCKGTMIHSKKGVRDIPRKNEIMTIDRNQLVLTLLDTLSSQYSEPALTVAFNCTCDRIDDEQQIVSFVSTEGERFSVHYKRLIGADGARSIVRQQLSDHYGLAAEVNTVPDAYKSIFLTRKNPQKNVEFAPNRIHSTDVGKHSRIILAPQPGDQLHGAFIFTAGQNPLQAFTTKEEILDYFETHLPAFRAVISPEEAEALLNRPTARLLTVKCAQFHYGDRILLIGDAAHAVSPSIGQGCNSALEDISILNQCLNRNQENWAKTIAQFSQSRVVDAHALVELSAHSFPRARWLIPEFLFRLTIGRKLSKWFPQWFHPFVFDLVLDSAMPYSEVLRLSQGWINKVKRSTERLNLTIKVPVKGSAEEAK